MDCSIATATVDVVSVTPGKTIISADGKVFQAFSGMVQVDAAQLVSLGKYAGLIDAARRHTNNRKAIPASMRSMFTSKGHIKVGRGNKSEAMPPIANDVVIMSRRDAARQQIVFVIFFNLGQGQYLSRYFVYPYPSTGVIVRPGVYSDTLNELAVKQLIKVRHTHVPIAAFDDMTAKDVLSVYKEHDVQPTVSTADKSTVTKLRQRFKMSAADATLVARTPTFAKAMLRADMPLAMLRVVVGGIKRTHAPISFDGLTDVLSAVTSGNAPFKVMSRDAINATVAKVAKIMPGDAKQQTVINDALTRGGVVVRRFVDRCLKVKKAPVDWNVINPDANMTMASMIRYTRASPGIKATIKRAQKEGDVIIEPAPGRMTLRDRAICSFFAGGFPTDYTVIAAQTLATKRHEIMDSVYTHHHDRRNHPLSLA